jgi:hypothetical protein
MSSRLCDVVFAAHDKQISSTMYNLLNALLLQRRIIFVIATAIDATFINAQFAFFKVTTTI